MLSLKTQQATPFISEEELQYLLPFMATAHRQLESGTGPGSDFTGWYHVPEINTENNLQRIEKVAARLRESSDIFLVLGIGGSYLGARTVIEACNHHFPNFLDKSQRGAPLVLFAGHQLSEDYLAELCDIIEDYDVSLNVVSKSGTTTETAIAFRILRSFMEKKYSPEELKQRIVVTTDANKGALRSYADEAGVDSFVVPDDIGGRYSVLSAVGLLPIAVAGINIRDLLDGGTWAYEKYLKYEDGNINDCINYALMRHLLAQRGYWLEMMVNYEPSMTMFTEWWKQLFGESEGKNGRGIFPAGANFTTDLHSLGQYIQEGRRILFETSILFKSSQREIKVPRQDDNSDQLNYLAGRRLHEINQTAALATSMAHVRGGVPNMSLEVSERSPRSLGALIYFFEKACALSGYLDAINPFDQPGVEAYKKNMFALLGKPSYEDLRAKLMEEINN
ncbi:MAG: glucose-6-phosphate isomerase [Clostridiaceae bacterium]|jgi:glucose-6-phosphate isomerase|nr:glucose-6-phosphate isomerase [Clostridiaceae bacterium]